MKDIIELDCCNAGTLENKEVEKNVSKIYAIVKSIS